VRKLKNKHRFVDLSAYGHFISRWMVRVLAPLGVSSIMITWLFFIVGLWANAMLVSGQFIAVAILLPVKSIIDGADGAMARYLNRPSYTGRYLDSIFDFILNGLLFFALAYVSYSSYWLAGTAWFSWQIQGTFYNYYYVIRRHQTKGDDTSRVDETDEPAAYPYESASMVRFLHRIYLICYGWQDAIARFIDSKAILVRIPNWFMTCMSVFGLGFQLLLFGLILVFLTPYYLWLYVIVYANIWLLCLLLMRRFLGK
jgi:hypothetical protein